MPIANSHLVAGARPAGSTLLAKRKVGEKMLAALRAGDIVISTGLDRLFRNAQDALTQLEDFRVREIACVLLDDMAPTTIAETGAGQLPRRLHDRPSDSRGTRRPPGRPLGGIPRWGFSLDENGVEGRNAREQAITKQIQTLHREGHSFTRIVRELEKRGMFKRKGDPVTSASVPLRLLSTMSIRRQRARTKQGVRGDE